MIVEWQIGDSVGLMLDQVSGEEITDVESLEKMIDEINELIGHYGFKIRASGRWQDFRKMAMDEQLYISNLSPKP